MDEMIENKILELELMLGEVSTSKQMSTEIADSLSMLAEIVSSMPSLVDDKFIKLIALIEDLSNTIDTIKKMEGQPGQPGKDATVDYPMIIDSVLELIPPSKAGEPGKDGVIADTKELTQEINKIDGKVKWSVLEDFDSIVNQNTLKLALETLENQVRFLIQRNSGGSGGGNWTPQGITTDGAGGIPVGTQLGTSPISIEQTLIDIFYPASGPTVTLATSPTAGLVEAGDTITSVDLTPTTTQGTLPITTLTLSGTDGYAFSYPTPSPTGATEPTQTDGTGFVTTTSFTATVSDGTYTGTATKTFTYVFPYYKGVQVAGYSSVSIAADGGSLTKVVAGNPFTLSLAFTTVAQVPYLVYPASYGKLKKVLDISSFDVSTDWGTQPGGPNTDITPTYNGGAPINVTNSFGSVVSCYVYEFANITTTTQTYTFSQ